VNGRQTKKLSYRLMKLLSSLEKAEKNDGGLRGLTSKAREMYNESRKLADERLLAEAKRRDGNDVCWELFFPRTKTPLGVGMFDVQKVVTRTPERVFTAGEFFTIKDEWRLAQFGIYPDLDRAWHREPFDLEQFRRYQRDLEVSLRRYYSKEGIYVGWEKEAA